MFQGYSIKDFLEELHKMLLSTLIGNTTENVDVVCIRFYTVNLVKERGLRENHAQIPLKHMKLVEIRPMIRWLRVMVTLF